MMSTLHCFYNDVSWEMPWPVKDVGSWYDSVTRRFRQETGWLEEFDMIDAKNVWKVIYPHTSESSVPSSIRFVTNMEDTDLFRHHLTPMSEDSFLMSFIHQPLQPLDLYTQHHLLKEVQDILQRLTMQCSPTDVQLMSTLVRTLTQQPISPEVQQLFQPCLVSLLTLPCLSEFSTEIKTYIRRLLLV